MTNNAFYDDFAPNQQIDYCSFSRRPKCKSFLGEASKALIASSSFFTTPFTL
jgi:hypothetical protein